MLFRRGRPIRHSLQNGTEFRTLFSNLRQHLDSHRIRRSHRRRRRCCGCRRRRWFRYHYFCRLFGFFGCFCRLFRLFSFFIDFSDPEEAGVGEDVRAYDDGTDSYSGGDVLRGLRRVFAASTSWLPDFWEMVSLDP
jgi:hypothetical protein